jgi:predicted transcriptional regulator
MSMTIELSASIERELRNLAVLQNRDVCELVEEAVRQYLEAAAITDLDTADVAETQAALAGDPCHPNGA